MELRVLRYFLAVAREESISAAAEYLHITQPTLSRQLMDLEDELGAKLLNRGGKNRNVTLTEEGMLLRQRAEEIVELADKTQSDFTMLSGAIAGEISIGAGETQGMRFIARAARSIRAVHPEIRFHLYSGNAEAVTERLDKGLLDFGLLLGSVDPGKYNFLTLPVEDRWGVLLRADHPLAQKEAVRAEDLWNEALLVSRQALERSELSAWLNREESRLHIAATYNLIYNAAILAEEGIGVALTLDGLTNTRNTDLVFRPLRPAVTVPLHIVWKKYPAFSRASELFLRRLRAQLAAEQADAPSQPPA